MRGATAVKQRRARGRLHVRLADGPSISCRRRGLTHIELLLSSTASPSSDLNLLKHDKPLAAPAAAAAAAHLKHLPAYLRDPSLQGRSFAGNAGAHGPPCPGLPRPAATLLPGCCPAALLPCCPAAALPCCPAALLRFTPAALLPAPAGNPPPPTPGLLATPPRRAAGRGVLPARKRRKTEGLDPVKGFVRAPRKGGE